MILCWPERVVGPPELPELERSERTAPVATILCVVVVALCLLESWAGLTLLQGWPGRDLARQVSLFAASLRLYPEPGLFAPQQILTAAFLHPPLAGTPAEVFSALWSVSVDAALLLVLGRVWERRFGAAAWITVVALAAPLVGLIHLRRLAEAMPVLTSSSLVAALVAATALALPARRLRLRAVWWALTSIGVAPLHLDLRLAIVAYVVLDAIRASFGSQPLGEHVLGLIAGAILGALLGAGARLVFRS